MGLKEVDDYICKDTELQNYTKTGMKRIINPFIFQNNFQFLPLHFLYFEKNVLRVSFEMPPSDKKEIHSHVTLDDFSPHSDMGDILKNILNACFFLLKVQYNTIQNLFI